MEKTFTLYYNKVTEQGKNNMYPYSKCIHSLEDLEDVMAYDHVCAEYKDNKRSKQNFIKANCSMFDVDNTHSENPDEWITPKAIQDKFPNVPFYVSYSRNHNKQKGDKGARPKFHIYFPVEEFTDSIEYEAHKNSVCMYFTKFDPNAKDVARFFFGVQNPTVEYFNGEILLSDFMKTKHSDTPKDIDTAKSNQIAYVNKENEVIPEGMRNSSMFNFALSSLVRNGENEGNTYQLFLRESEKCVPRLEQKELNNIWKSALKKYQEIKLSPDYIPPEEFANKSTNHFPLQIVDKSIIDKICKTEHKKRKLNIESTQQLLNAFGIKVRYNEMNGLIEVEGLPEQFSGGNECNLLEILITDIAYTLSFKRAQTQLIHDNLFVIAKENSYHPVRELLQENDWDNIDRLPDIFGILGLRNDFHKILVKKWAIQTIAMLYNNEKNPMSAQGILVLQGEQGVGKTLFFRQLAIYDRFFKGGATLDMNNKDSLMSATKVWICELGEIDSTTKKEQSALKAFITEHTDRFREPYARNENIRIRRTSFCGTVNPKYYLRDETGNRRYWTISVGDIDIEKLVSLSPEWYTQFWLQIKKEYEHNKIGYLLTREEQEKVNQGNADFETDVKGESEFVDSFDFNANISQWEYVTAADITNSLNSKYKSLNIRSEYVGRTLLPRIEKRLNVVFKRKIVRGRKLICCPPFVEGELPTQPYELQPYVPFPPRIKLNDKIDDFETTEF